MSNTSTPTGDCAGFEGNPDLYGLGIRTGVYLQWYSSWLSISVEPRTAAETHTANTVFMFAIVVAVLRSIRSGNIRPVEAWLMLQICLGYVFTVVSIFGLRLQLLRPRQWEAVMATASRRFATALEKFKSKKTNNTWPSVDLRSLFLKSPQKSPLSNHEARKIRLSELAYFKDTSLSWTGSLWRTVTISLVMATNLWLLIRGVDTMPSKGACGGYGYIFIFSRQAIDKTTRIILAVFGVLFTLPLAAILLGLFWTVLNLIFTCIVSWAIAISDPERETTGEFISLYAKFIGLLPDIISIIPVRGTLLGGIIATSRALQKGSNIGAGVLLRTYASISIASARIEQERTYERPHNNKKDKWSVALCCLWHVGIIGSILYFILSVELTIHWNGIRGVGELDTTGQLIPFVVGVVSFAKAVHESFLSWIKYKYEDWDEADIEFTLDVDGSPVAAIPVMREA